jgi:integrase/recombinase XerD
MVALLADMQVPITPDMTHLDSTVYLHAWDLFMRANSMAQITRHHYSYAMLRLMSHHVGKHVFDIGETEIVAFLAGLDTKAHSKALYNRGFRSFYGWAAVRHPDLLPVDPTVLLHPKPPRRTRPQPFSTAEVTALVTAAFDRSPRRGWAILACLGLGMRRGEFCLLRPSDIDWDHMEVHIRPETAKGQKERYVDISPLAADALHELERWSNGTVLGVQPQTFTAWVNDAARKAGFPPGRKRRAHTLRATYATLLEHEGVPTSVIQSLLGHESIATTSWYMGIYSGEGAAAASKLTTGMFFPT